MTIPLPTNEWSNAPVPTLAHSWPPAHHLLVTNLIPGLRTTRVFLQQCPPPPSNPNSRPFYHPLRPSHSTGTCLSLSMFTISYNPVSSAHPPPPPSSSINLPHLLLSIHMLLLSQPIPIHLQHRPFHTTINTLIHTQTPTPTFAKSLISQTPRPRLPLLLSSSATIFLQICPQGPQYA